MNGSAKTQSELRDLFPKLSEGELQDVEQYFNLALEIAEQDSILADKPVDISASISTLKERSNSNLKD